MANIVKLRGGEVEVDESTVTDIMDTLRHEFKTIMGALMVSEFVRTCRDADFVITDPDLREALIDTELVQRFDEDGRAIIPEVIRSITLAGTVGKGLDLRFRDPIER
jgi:hypothetical protein